MAISASLIPAAATAEPGIVGYVTTDKLPAGKRVQFDIVCAVDCKVTIREVLKLDGPDLKPVITPGTLAANAVATPFIILNKPAVRALVRRVRAARLVTGITATDLNTGQTQRIRKVFKFKRVRAR